MIIRRVIHTNTIAAAIHTTTLMKAMNRIMAMAGRGTFFSPGNRRCDRSACLTNFLMFHLLPTAPEWPFPSEAWLGLGLGGVESRMVDE